MNRKFILLVLVIAGVSSIGSSVVNAQEDGYFSVNPTKIEVDINPGETKTFEIFITNNTGRDTDFVLGAEDIIADSSSEGYINLLGEQESERSLKNYLMSDMLDVLVKNGERRRVPVTVRLPQDVQLGGLYGAITISVSGEEAEAGGTGSLGIRTRVAVAVLARVGSEVKYGGRLVKFETVGGEHLYTKGVIKVQLLYENTGDMHVSPSGVIEVKNMFGVIKKSINIEPWVVFPDSERSYIAEIDTKGLFGRYSLDLTLDVGFDGSSKVAKIYVWVLPWTGIAITLILICMLYLAVRGLALRKLAIVVLALILIVPGYMHAQVATSTNYQLERDSLNFGGTYSTSSTYTVEDTGGEVGTGYGTSSTYSLQAGYQQDDVYTVSITSPANVSLSPNIYTLGGGSATGDASWTVVTDNPSGYTLAIKASTDPAMKSSDDNFADYTKAGANPDYTWSVGSGVAEFGFSPEGSDITATYLDNGLDTCGAGTGSADTCWDEFLTTNKTIATSGSDNNPLGTATTVKFRAEAESAATKSAGDYSATITLTATAL